MSSDDARDFRRRQAYNVKKIDYTRYNGRSHEVYTSKKGTAHRIRKNSKKISKKMKLKFVSLLLATSIGIGGISVVGSLNKEHEINITQLQEMGVNINKIGLKSDTIEMLEEYDEYFASFDSNEKQELNEEDLISMAEDIKSLNFNVIKDKVADLRNVNREDVALDFTYEKADGEFLSSISIEKIKETYTSANALPFGIGKKNHIPDEIANLIVQTDSYVSIINDVKEDKLTKANAVKKLEKLYRNISSLATKDLSMDEKGNINLIEYNLEKNITEQER